MSFRTPLGKVKGLGSAKDGTLHWIMQRVSAIAMIPFVFWLIYSFIFLAGKDNSQIAEWFYSPINSLSTTLFILISFFHGYLGVRTVIEDYVHNEWKKIFLIVFMQIACFAAAVTGIFAIMNIYFSTH